jgi:EAL domain-containing protein (putative c-di-GMP-specific phosphodiesterase class I)
VSSALAKASVSVTATAEEISAESLGRLLRAALPPLRLHSVSLYNAEGDVLWLSEGALGPDEHSVVLEAMEALHVETQKSYHEMALEDGRFGMFLPVRAPRGDLVGLAMILADPKNLPDGIAERLAVPKMRTILQRIAVFLRVGSSRAGDTTPKPVFPAAAANSEAVTDEVLTFELEPAKPAEVASDLALHVQELIKLRSNGRTRRYEVLARSRRDEGREEVPSAFLAAAAKGPDGAALDQLVVEHLVAWLREHPQIWEGEPASFSINLSVGALEDEKFIERIGALLKSAGVPAGSIGFEISEPACVQSKTAVQRFMSACEKLGCFVVLDNFTFDSAALSLLSSKAIRMVKIDSKLTNGAMKEKLAQAVVVAISQACKVLGIHCIAKRVENQSALDWLEAVGCDLAQGFALERPLSLETLAAPATVLPRKRARA